MVFHSAIEVVKHILAGYLDAGGLEQPLELLDKDYKTQLQEITQSRLKLTPSYALEREEGPDHDKVFYMSVTIQGRVIAHGRGKSKKDAQQLAAKRAIEKLSIDPDALGDTA